MMGNQLNSESILKGREVRKGLQLMISGVQKALISRWYPFDILDIRLLDSVETWLFSAVSKVFYSLTIVYGYMANI